MSDIYYSIIGILAIIIHGIFNFDIFKTNNDKRDTSFQIYRRFSIAVFAFYIVDALWGILDAAQIMPLLYADTVAYFITMAFTVVYWCRYVTDYLKMEGIAGKFINIVGLLYFIAEVVMLVINRFVQFYFWFDEAGGYHADTGRFAALVIQVFFFSYVALLSFIVAIRSEDSKRRRHIAICFFSVAMTVAAVLQVMHSLLPVYTMGLILGECLLHVFVQEDEREEYRKKLQETSDIIENAGFGIWRIYLHEEGCNTMYGDDKFKRILGIENMNLSPEELYVYHHCRLQGNPVEIENMYKEMREGKVRSSILAWEHSEKGTIYLRAGGTAHIEENGERTISGYCGDVTEQKFYEDELNAKMEEANKAKTRFLFNMSHDIRTPMNAIIGFTDLMEKNADDPEKCRDYRRKIRSSSQFLLSLINNVLEMARIESGKVCLENEICDMTQIIANVKDVFETQMEEKSIDFLVKVNVKHNLVYGDSVKIREIFLNLISNAYKYTPEGGRVRVTLEELKNEKEGYLTYHIRVMDSGLGMSKEFLPTIFEEFSREKTYTDNKIEGTGLGMPIVKHYVDLMDGTISVESQLGRGTRFDLAIPHKIADEEQQVDTSYDINYDKFVGKRILIAEDNDLNAEIAEEILKDVGFLVERAEDGRICYDMLRKASTGYYSLILMDIQMPNMNGLQATEAIRAMDDYKKASIPILAMTANAFAEDRRRTAEVGMNGHVAKPIVVKDLMQAISNVIA